MAPPVAARHQARWTALGKWQGTATFCLGLFMIFARWAVLGCLVELYGLLVLFGEVLGSWAGVVGQVPVVGGVLRAVTAAIGKASGRVSGEQAQPVLPV
ncbi:Golgi Transport [Ascosphaera acerosa]|nr:Golgi Transport [Ascosphaera acerosa]